MGFWGFGAAPVAGALIKGAGSAVRAAGDWAGSKLLSSFGGVKPEVISEYLGASDRINSAKTLPELKALSDEYVGRLRIRRRSK